MSSGMGCGQLCHNFLIATNSFWQTLHQLRQRSILGEHVDSQEYLRTANVAMQDAYVDLTITCGARPGNRRSLQQEAPRSPIRCPGCRRRRMAGPKRAAASGAPASS